MASVKNSRDDRILSRVMTWVDKVLTVSSTVCPCRALVRAALVRGLVSGSASGARSFVNEVRLLTLFTKCARLSLSRRVRRVSGRCAPASSRVSPPR
eukprot:1741308-Pyramimonas_sp.AAC.1